jgi:DNA polymerase-3 subunit epsilon
VPSEPTQRSLDDLGPALDAVTFCVIDVETTGGRADDGAITEIGAVRLRGGVCLDTWSSLVDPGIPIPRSITVLTGISAATVADAPPAREVLPSLVEFLGCAVFVGHNVRYDASFLNAELGRAGLAPLANRQLDTLALARRLVRDEVPNCKLSTLATHLRLTHRPSHRALDDALATGDLLHALIERATAFGVGGLDVLGELPRLANHPDAAKIRLTDVLPRTSGVYLFKDRRDTVIYVGKATDLRSRVRSYFTSDDRRKVGALLRDVERIDFESCSHPLEAAVREIHLIHEHLPRYNQRSTRWRSMAYLKLTEEAFPRFSVVRVPPTSDSTYVGPLPSASFAHTVADAVTSVVPLRRCTMKVPASRATAEALALDFGTSEDRAPCTASQLGVSCCPCSGETTPLQYAALVESIRRGLGPSPDELLEPLSRRLIDLASQERFEEAADARDRASALAEALLRQRRLETWRAPVRIVVERADGAGAELHHGRLVRSWPAGERPSPEPVPNGSVPHGPIPRDEVDERLSIVSELERAKSPWSLLHVDGVLASPIAPVRRFTERRSTQRDRVAPRRDRSFR